VPITDLGAFTAPAHFEPGYPTLFILCLLWSTHSKVLARKSPYSGRLVALLIVSSLLQKFFERHFNVTENGAEKSWPKGLAESTGTVVILPSECFRKTWLPRVRTASKPSLSRRGTLALRARQAGHTEIC
jgi:hypothetical protein